jgi:hypothetical protein
MKKTISHTWERGESMYDAINDISGEFSDEMINFEDKNACFSDKTKITITIEEIGVLKSKKYRKTGQGETK